MNKVILLGRLAKDVEVKYTQAAEPLAVANFSIAVDRSYKKDGEVTADFFNCVCFGKRGENIGQYFHKGNKIAIVGRLQNRTWTDNNRQKRYATDVVVEEFDFCESRSSSEYSQSYTPSYPQSAPMQGNNSPADGFFFSEDSGDDDLPF